MKRFIFAGLLAAVASGPLLADGISNPGAAARTYARTQSNPSNPSGTVSASAVMLGLAGTITPTATGNVLFMARYDVQNGTASDGCVTQIQTGTGTAPTNGAASTGTAVGGPSQLTESTAVALVPGSLIGYQTGLTLNTALWFDVSLRAVTGGTCQASNFTLIAIEQ